MLSVSDVAFGYAGAIVGEHANLTVSAGDVICLLGPNGCGKTTLFKTLLGLVPALGGEVDFDGRRIRDHSRKELAKRLAYVPQASSAYFPFSIFDIVLMGRSNHMGLFGAPSRTDHKAAQAALTSLGISHLAQRPISEVSGGERQLAMIARALAQEPQEFLVMDEPTASLDFGNQARVLECICRLAKSGLAILLSTHDPSHALACADRTALMKNGRLVAFGPTHAVVTPTNLSDIYGIDVVVADIEGLDRRVCIPVIELEAKGAMQ